VLIVIIVLMVATLSIGPVLTERFAGRSRTAEGARRVRREQILERREGGHPNRDLLRECYGCLNLRSRNRLTCPSGAGFPVGDLPRK
jgi:hypothetical protein